MKISPNFTSDITEEEKTEYIRRKRQMTEEKKDRADSRDPSEKELGKDTDGNPPEKERGKDTDGNFSEKELGKDTGENSSETERGKDTSGKPSEKRPEEENSGWDRKKAREMERSYWGGEPVEEPFEQRDEEAEGTLPKERKRHPFRDFLRHMSNRITRDHVSAYAAQSTFFLMLSFIPFVLLLLQLVPFVPLTESQMTSGIVSAVPEEFQGTLRLVISQLSQKSIAVFSVSAIIMLWSAGKAIHSLTAGLNVINRIKRKGFLFNRMRAMFYTVILILVIILTLVVMVFGKPIQQEMIASFPSVSAYTGIILDWGSVIMLFVLVAAFSLLYSFVSNKFLKIWEQLIGAFFAAVSWEVLALLFSWLINLVPGFSNMYGSLTMVLMIMIWMYWGLFLFFLGAELNHYLWLRNLSERQKRQLYSLWRRFTGMIPVEMMAGLVTGGRKKQASPDPESEAGTGDGTDREED